MTKVWFLSVYVCKANINKMVIFGAYLPDQVGEKAIKSTSREA